jgi:hypothetical protein
MPHEAKCSSHFAWPHFLNSGKHDEAAACLLEFALHRKAPLRERLQARIRYSRRVFPNSLLIVPTASLGYGFALVVSITHPLLAQLARQRRDGARQSGEAFGSHPFNS